MRKGRWITCRDDADDVRAEQDRYDREVLGIEPLGKPGSKATKLERAAYWARREEAMRRKFGKSGKLDRSASAARERQRAANIERAEKEKGNAQG